VLRVVIAWTLIDLQGKQEDSSYIAWNHFPQREALPVSVVQLQPGLYIRDADALPFPGIVE
jgi:hypothetical protein